MNRRDEAKKGPHDGVPLKRICRSARLSFVSAVHLAIQLFGYLLLGIGVVVAPLVLLILLVPGIMIPMALILMLIAS